MTLKPFLLVTLLFFLLNCEANAQKDWVSPCPRLFVYEGKSKHPNRWYGIITLLTETEVNGVWIRVAFDRPAKSVGNWFGQVETTDFKEYLIKNRDHTLKAHEPQSIRFYVEYDPTEPPPKLMWFRLNAKTICPEGAATEPPPVVPQLQISSFIDRDSGGSSSTTTRKRPSTTTPPSRPSQTNGNSNNVCGTVIAQPKPLIVNGQETAEGEFPWHAAVYHIKGAAQKYACGGSLISKWYVITAGHCVTKRGNQKPLHRNNLYIFLGKFHLKRFTNPGVQEREVSEVIPHPEYNGQTIKNDIALLKLETEADITDYVRPVCLWQDSLDINTVVDKQGSVAGWGSDETGTLSEDLMQAQMPVVADLTCIRSYPEFYSRFTSDTTFCAGFRNGASVCSGDSGGGLVFPKANSRSRHPVWQLRGIVSISPVINGVACDTSYYVVFTDIAKYLDWIKSTMK